MDTRIFYSDWGYHKIDSLYYMDVVQLVLSATVTIAVVLRANSIRRFHPYLGAGLASLAYLLQEALRIGKQDSSKGIYIGSYFFGSIASSILWCIAFDSLREGVPTNLREKFVSSDLPGVKLAYLWTVVIIITAIAVAIKMATLPNYTYQWTGQPIDGALFFLAFAPWIYFIIFFAQLYCYQQDFIQHYICSLCGYIILLVIINIGSTLQAIYAFANSDILYWNSISDTGSTIPSLTPMIIANFFTHYFAIGAIVILIACGHNWGRGNEIIIRSYGGTRDIEQGSSGGIVVVRSESPSSAPSQLETSS